MPIPKLFELPNEKLIVAQNSEIRTIACVSCKRPLWELSDFKEYGTRTSCKKKAYPGVKEYDDIWSKDGKACSDLACPFCQEQFLTAIKVKKDGKDHVFPVPYVLEFQGV